MNSYHHFITFVAFAAILLSMTACSDRERLNPLDPSNPYSEGAPTGFRLFSQRNAVTLQWTPMDVNDLRQYNIYRSIEHQAQAKYDSVPSAVTTYVDENLIFDKRYAYAVQAVTDYDASLLSNELSIVPGNADFILADYYNQSLQRITYDCSRSFEFYDGYTPTDLAIINDCIYFTNLWDNSLKFIERNGNVQSFGMDESPVDFACDTTNGIIYILTRDNNSLFTFTVDGEYRGKTSLDADVHFYTTCAYDPLLDCLWITDNQNHKIYRYDLASDVLIAISETLSGPDEIIIDDVHGGCWIAAAAGIIHVQSDNAVELFMPNHNIYDLSPVKSTGRLYYTSFSKEIGAWEIGFFDNGTTTTLYTEYEFIYKIKTVPETIGAGLALIDGNRAQIIRINARGEEIGRRSGVYGITGIELQ